MSQAIPPTAASSLQDWLHYQENLHISTIDMGLARVSAVRDAMAPPREGVHLAATSPHPQLLVVRALAPLVEPLMIGLQHAWAALRTAAWQLDAPAPRIWRV